MKKLACPFVLLLCVVHIDLCTGTKNSVCPEFKKLYPRDCRLFYKCVPLLDSAHAYVWVPTRCTAGLVFHPTLKACVLPEDWKCKNMKEDNEFSYYEVGEKSEDNKFVPIINNGDVKFDTSIKIHVTESNILNTMDQNSVPFSLVNNPSIDTIGSQMDHLKGLINSLKASSTPIPQATTQVSYQQFNPAVYIHSIQNPSRRGVTKDHQDKATPQHFVHDEPNKTTTHLAPEIPPHHNNINSLESSNEYDVFSIKQNLTENLPPNTADLVNSLFEKYLSNNSFLNGGEFVKNVSLAPIEIAKNPEQASKISTVIGLTDKNSFTVHNYRTSLIPNVKSSQRTSCLEGERLPNLSDCTRYYICGSHNNIIHVFTCPPKTAFNKIRTKCETDEFKRCAPRNNAYTDKVNEQDNTNKIDDMNCKSRGRFPVPQSSTQYVVCIFQDKVGWKPYQLNCPINLEFCTKKQTCLPKQSCN